MTSEEIEEALSSVKEWLDGSDEDSSEDETAILDNNTTLQKDAN